MKILQLIPRLVSGGAEQAVVDINAALVQAGHSSFVASSGGALVSTIEAAGGVHEILPLAAKNPLQVLQNTARLRELILKHDIEIVHARSRAPAWSGLWAAQLTGRAFMTTFHAAYAFDNPVKKFYNSIMARGARVIAISDFIANHIRENYHVPEARLATIHRGVDLTRFNPGQITPERIQALHAAWGVPEGRRLIILPARQSRIKGHAVLIEALRQLAVSHPYLLLYTVMIGAEQGHDNYVQELREQISAAGLAGQIKLAGHCADMPAAYAGADLAVAPSLVAEGFGRVPVEAQAMGIPAIASALGGGKETILPNETGWLVPPGDPGALARQIAACMALTPEARTELAQRAIRHVRERFDLVQMAQRTLEVYGQLAAQKS